MCRTIDRQAIHRHRTTRAYLALEVRKYDKKIERINHSLQRTPRYRLIKRYRLNHQRAQLVAIINTIKVEIDRIDTTIANIEAWAGRP